MGGTHQTTLDGVVVHVIKLLQALLFAVNVKGIESALPDAVVGLLMDARRQTESRQHLPAATVFRVLAKGSEDASRRSILQTLEDQTHRGRWFGPVWACRADESGQA